jgi:tetratricopeptide (TPR) repeat protein
MAGTDFVMIAIGVVATIGALAYFRASSSASPAQIRQLIEQGLRYEAQNDYIEAQLTLERALKQLETQRRPDLQQHVSVLVHLGNCYERLGKPELAREVFGGAIASWAKALREQKLELIDVDYAVTNLNFGRGTLDVCEFYVDNIVTLRERALPKGHPDLDMSYKIGANLLRKSGYIKEAELLEERGRNGPPPP